MSANGLGLEDSQGLAGYARGVVYAGAAEVRYFRAGRGSPVVVLGECGPLQARVCRALDSRFQIVVPALDARAATGFVGDLLRQIVDGLGLSTPHLVVDAVYGAEALGFVLGDTDRVDRLAILCRIPLATGSDGAELADTLRDTGHALMVVNLEAGEGAVTGDSLQLDALIAFLDGGGGERACGSALP